MQATFSVELESTLLPFLFEQLPEVKRTKVRQWLKFEGIQVNGEVVKRGNHRLVVGDLVSIAPKAKPPPGSDLPVGMQWVFQDRAIMVIVKPAKLLSIATKSETVATAYSKLMEHVKMTEKGGRGRVWIVHRLERDVSGLMVFGRSEQAKQQLQAWWEQAEKKYLAVVEGVPPQKSGELRSYLDDSQPLQVYPATSSEQGSLAVTRYRVIRKTDHRAVVELIPETSVRHQSRVQLAELGCPIVGDERYGLSDEEIEARLPRSSRLCLHASELSFPHPETEQRKHFTSELPPEMAKMMRLTKRG